jgi:hypothetical protein
MFVTVLSRLDGAGLSSYAGNDFADVAVGSWYAAPVQWASQNGIVTGIGNRRFDPDANVTREQMAVIMYRYSEYKGMETGQTDRAKYEAFTDHDRVSDWAAEAVIWAVSRNLVNGMGDGTLAPSAASTRAQVAKIVSQYDELIAGNSSTGEAEQNPYEVTIRRSASSERKGSCPERSDAGLLSGQVILFPGRS